MNETQTQPHTQMRMQSPTRIVPFIPAAVATPVSAPAPAPSPTSTKVPAPMFAFQSSSYFAGYELPQDCILVGDCHITRGDITVVGGAPGCGKSRLMVSLAIAGMQGPGAEWMGLPVHAPFKTAILQAENGEVRLKRELESISRQGHDLDGWLYITPPPRTGLAFTSPEFRAQLREWIAEVRPGVLVIDPWNRCVLDDKAKDYRAILDYLLEILPESGPRPAIVIVHHLRKASAGEGRRRGRDLLNELSGSYVIGSACRVAFMLEPVTPHEDDDRVIFTCAKNNNGDMGRPTAWRRRNGLFEECADFDWDELDEPENAKREKVSAADLEAVFAGKPLSKAAAVEALRKRCGVGKSAAYNALDLEEGRFREWLVEAGGLVTFRGAGVGE